jgi:hypothetical protein
LSPSVASVAAVTRREIAVRHGRLLRVTSLFGQIRTLELRNSARIVQML